MYVATGLTYPIPLAYTCMRRLRCTM